MLRKIQTDMLVIVPMYNEVESIELMINKLNELQLNFIIVDNNSTDGCTEIAVNLGADVYQRDEYGTGYGCAIMKGLNTAHQKGYKYLGIVDCDVSYDPEYFFEMEQYMPNYKMIMGARDFGDIALIRRIGNNLHTYFANMIYRSSMKDVNTGLRIVEVAYFREYVTEKFMGMVPQMTSFALRNKLEIKEIPIKYKERLGDSKLNKLKDGWAILMAIWRERLKKRVF